jgi:hypothetical protein
MKGKKRKQSLSLKLIALLTHVVHVTVLVQQTLSILSPFNLAGCGQICKCGGKCTSITKLHSCRCASCGESIPKTKEKK